MYRGRTVDWFITNCQAVIDESGGIILSLFLLGLISGFTHCAGMCGPFILMQTGRDDGQEAFLRRMGGRLLLPYHIGKMATYMILGAVGAVASNILFGQALKQVAAFALIGMAIFLILRFMGVGREFLTVKRQLVPAAFTELVSKMARPFVGRKSVFSRFLLGVTLGLMPCGLLYGALFAAAVAAEPISASFAMGAFALGTMPALFLVGLGGQFLKQTWPGPVHKIQHTLIGINGAALMIIGGGMLL